MDHELVDLYGAVRRDGVHGIIAGLHTPAMEEQMVKLGIPVVNISNSIRAPHLPVVTQDDVAVGRLAAEHLKACGCRGFGFWGQAGASHSDQRWEGFSQALSDVAHVHREARRWDETPAQFFPRMRTWLTHIQRPIGVFGVLDTYALTLIRAARDLGLRVPEDVAVLGAGDDDFYVEFESVPLSSVRLPTRKIGYEAAALLDRILSQRARSSDSIYLPVSMIAQRKSTDIQFVDDPLVARAVRLIREQPTLCVAEVVRMCGVARSGLQLRFKRAIGRGLLEEIHRVRLLRAQTLLATTKLKLEVVAAQAGFASVQRLSAVFRARLHRSPGEYRRNGAGV